MNVMQDESKREINVGSHERHWSVLGGMALGTIGLKHRSLLLSALGAGLIYRGLTGHCPAYTAAHINTAQGERTQPEDFDRYGVHVDQTFTINKPAEELYAFWKNFENLPKFLDHVRSVEKTGERTSRWVVDGPAGTTVQWTAEITADEPNQRIAWQSTGGADVDSRGTVSFTPLGADRGTAVRATLDYIPPGGKAGAALAWLFGKSAQQQVTDDLRRFKQLMETGETPRTEGQPVGSAR